MTDQEIDDRAQEIAHDNSPACRNRPESIAVGPSRACQKLARVIADAMREARDSRSNTAS